MKVLQELFRAWTWRMAWRDSRRERKRLLVFSLSIVFGVAALVGIGSLNHNLGDTVETQAKDLLGSDLMLGSRRPFLAEHGPEPLEDPAASVLVNGLPGERAVEVSFTTMIYFPKGEGSRLVNVRAVDPAFPFFGNVVTSPAGAWARYQAGEGAVLDGAIAEQFGVVAGDIAKIGSLEVPVLGVFVQSPPQVSAFAAFAPQVFLPRAKVGETGLLGARSLAFYGAHFRIPGLEPGARVIDRETKDQLRDAGLRIETVEDRKRNLGKTLDRLYSFFSLIGFVALLLGGVGIASAIHVHITGRLKTVATLRCLGCTPARATAVFLAQGVALGAIGTFAGATLGVVIQQVVPRFFQGALPFEIDLRIVPGEVLTGAGIGFLICVAFTLLPLLTVRRVSPLAALRGGVALAKIGWRDPYRWLALGAVVGALTLLAIALSPRHSPRLGLGYMAALGAIVGSLALLARLVMALVRKWVGPRQPYVLRQGLANLYRPRNQTTLFLLSAGLGVCLVLTLYLTQHMLVSQIGMKAVEGKADTFLIDVQPDQRDGVVRILDELGLPVAEEVAMISMRLTGLKGKSIEAVQADDSTRVPNWILRRDFRSTYRSEITESEKLLRGDWVATWGSERPAPVSLEDGIADDLKLDLGDTLELSIGGIKMDFYVANIREVEWDEINLNFFMVFPTGVLEDAPSFTVMTTQTRTDAVTGALNRAIVQEFPNITVFDASLVLDTLQKIIGKVGWVIQFMALFTVFTGVIILVGTILSGKRDRVEESVLLRTLGASHAQVWRILVTEYALLGFFAATAGAILASIASWALARFVFELNFFTVFWPIPATIAAVTAFTVVVGLALSRGITRNPPLAVLRHEV